uniref:Uncharacterized protein n=1 Tax=Siphoviridae sp. ctZHD14 TaxID=2827891 RepID=A0A8S5SWL9_9CAUD|nr:MAG TPA: hypothetical protein [Siphoviridae sp. ctZHD14]
MFNPYGFNYPNYFQQQPQMASPEPQITGVKFVNNIQEANNCNIPLGAKAIFMDKNQDRFYLKETDFNNFSTLTEYEFKKVENLPREETDASFITREEFEKWRNQYESIVQQIQQSTDDDKQPNIQQSVTATDGIHQDNQSATSQTTSGRNAADKQSFFE